MWVYGKYILVISSQNRSKIAAFNIVSMTILFVHFMLHPFLTKLNKFEHKLTNQDLIIMY